MKISAQVIPIALAAMLFNSGYRLMALGGDQLNSPPTSWNYRYFGGLSGDPIENDDVDATIRVYNDIIRQNPQFAEAYFNRALLLMEKGDLNLAIGDLNEAININHAYTKAFIARGIAYIQHQNYNMAILDLNTAIRLSPTNCIALANRGVAYERLQKYDRAIADYNLAITLQPMDGRFCYNLGEVYLEKGEMDLALSNFNEAIILSPNFVNAYFDRGTTFLKRGQYDEAISDYTAAIKLQPEEAGLFYRRGEVFELKRDWTNAVSDFKDAVLLSTNYVQAMNDLAWICSTCPDVSVRNGTEAVVMAQRVCHITEWKNGNYIDTLAASYAESGDFAKAVSNEEKALSLINKEASVRPDMENRLRLYKEKKAFRFKIDSN